jgi:malate dehydrogenase (oxaloacetate-decarboxylating)(NADP+)
MKKYTSRGYHLLHDPRENRGTAFTEEEREQLGLRGLLPPRVATQDEQVARLMENYRRQTTDIDRYAYLTALQDRNERLFFRVVTDNIEEMMPIIYTPTVGAATQQFGHLFRHARGIYINPHDRGRIADVLRNWVTDDVAVIVVTDGERILGLGDLGANGMGIPIGKLSLYTACAGVDPTRCLPITLDVGTNNEDLRSDPLYLGLHMPRVGRDVYDDLIDEFVEAVAEVFPDALLQFEDFLTPNAFRLLDRYRDRILCFNDDIQGTAAVALGGLLAATRITEVPLSEMTILFAGAGSAAVGIADLIVQAMVEDGLESEEARRRCWFVDSTGLVVAERDDLAEHKLPYAHEAEGMTGLQEAVEHLKPHALIGATAQGGTFTRDIVEAEAYEWSEGRAVFASGSPFPAYETDDGSRLVPGQGNNVYIFPAMGLASVATRPTRITDEMFLAAARALANEVTAASLEEGSIYPPLRDIREVSIAIAIAVAEVAYDQNLAREPRQDDLEAQIRSQIYSVAYD